MQLINWNIILLNTVFITSIHPVLIYVVYQPEIPIWVNLSYVEHAKRYWDRLSPLQQCLHLDKCLHKQQIQKTLRTRNTAGMCSWGKLWTISYKKAKTQKLLLRCQEQEQGPVHDLCTQQQQGGGQAPKPHSSPTHQSTPPSPHLGNQPTRSGNNKDTCCFFLTPVLQLSPSKASLESLLCPLNNSIDWRVQEPALGIVYKATQL